MRFDTYAVRYITYTASDNLATKEKTFKTKTARTRFLDRLEDNGKLHEIVALSDPQ